jgi:hypothetical protein
LTCSIQAWPFFEDGKSGGHPAALELTSALVALKDGLKELVASVFLRLMKDVRVQTQPMAKKDLLGSGGVVILQMEDRFNLSPD